MMVAETTGACRAGPSACICVQRSGNGAAAAGCVNFASVNPCPCRSRASYWLSDIDKFPGLGALESATLSVQIGLRLLDDLDADDGCELPGLLLPGMRLLPSGAGLECQSARKVGSDAHLVVVELIRRR